MPEVAVPAVGDIVDRRPFFTRISLADYLGVSERLVDGLLSRGEIPSYKIAGSRRVAPADVDAYLESHREEGFAAA